MEEFPSQLKKNKLGQRIGLWTPKDSSELSEDREKTLRIYRRLGWIGFCISLAMVLVFIYRPLSLELSELERRQMAIKESLSNYKNFVPSEEIPASEMLPQILEQYRVELKREGIEIKSFNVEKFVSTAIPQNTLGYALVRVHLQTPNSPDAHQRLEEVEGRRIILEEIKITPSETIILIRVYFDI